MYQHSYLRWLDHAPQDFDGYPAFVTKEAKKWVENKVREELSKCPLPLWILTQNIFSSDCRHERPECIKTVVLWDAQYAIVYRALLAVDAMNHWSLKGSQKA